MAYPSTILIVEDDCLLAENLRTYLARDGRDVRVASNARQTKAILASFSPEAVVLDYTLPDIDGLRLYAEIVRPHVPHAGCVLMSGGLTDHLAHEAGKKGVHALLEKPFSLQDLRRHLERLSELPPPQAARQQRASHSGMRPSALSGGGWESVIAASVRPWSRARLLAG